ncbi:MAG: hypothetical protein V2B19_13720 [Pseudomonadota bacterium]
MLPNDIIGYRLPRGQHPVEPAIPRPGRIGGITANALSRRAGRIHLKDDNHKTTEFKLNASYTGLFLVVNFIKR